MAQAQTAFDWIYYRSLLIHISMNPIFYVRVYVVAKSAPHFYFKIKNWWFHVYLKISFIYHPKSSTFSILNLRLNDS